MKACQNFVGVVFCIWFFNYLNQGIGLIKDKSHAVDAVVNTPHKLFWTPNTKLLDDGFFGIGDEWKIELVLVYKFEVGSNAIGTNANDIDLCGEQRFLAVSDTTSLGSAARGVVFWVKVDH